MPPEIDYVPSDWAISWTVQQIQAYDNPVLVYLASKYEGSEFTKFIIKAQK